MASKRKSKKGGGLCPVEISETGIPVGENSLKLIYAISSVVTHCDIFPPYETWPEHKEAKRVEKLWKDLKEPWGLPEREETKKWFNLRANRCWSNNKSKVLKPYYNAAEGDIQKAIAHRPATLIGVEAWEKLCKQFQKSEDPGDESTGKSKSQKCKDARECNKMNHSLGRMSLEYWAHKHLKLFGKYPSVVQFYRKTYLRDDPTQPIDSSSQSDVSDVSGESSLVSRYPEAYRVLEELNKAFDEARSNGLEEVEANETALLKVFGESNRLHNVINSKNVKERSKRKRGAKETSGNIEMVELKESLEEEKIERRKLEEQLRLQEEKRQKSDEQLQMLISHFGLKGLMPPPLLEDNASHHTRLSDPSVEGEAW